MKTLITINIRGYHTDHFGHVNHSRYLEFLEEGRWGYMEENHLIDLFHAIGIIHVVARITVDYRRSATVGDTLRIETGLVEKGRSSFTMGQTVCLDGAGTEILAAGVTNVFVDTKNRKAVAPDCRLIAGWSDLAELNGKGGGNG